MCFFQNNLRFPDDCDDVSDDARDLIRTLITSPDKRLGQHGIDEFMGHPFFEGIEWSQLKLSKY